MLSVIMLSVVMLSVIVLSVVMLSVIMLNVVMLSVSVILLSVIMLSVVMLSVVASNTCPTNEPTFVASLKRGIRKRDHNKRASLFTKKKIYLKNVSVFILYFCALAVYVFHVSAIKYVPVNCEPGACIVKLFNSV
jgi:hypothetical protein